MWEWVFDCGEQIAHIQLASSPLVFDSSSTGGLVLFSSGACHLYVGEEEMAGDACMCSCGDWAKLFH